VSEKAVLGGLGAHKTYTSISNKMHFKNLRGWSPPRFLKWIVLEFSTHLLAPGLKPKTKKHVGESLGFVLESASAFESGTLSYTVPPWRGASYPWKGHGSLARVQAQLRRRGLAKDLVPVPVHSHHCEDRILSLPHCGLILAQRKMVRIWIITFQHCIN